MRPAGFRCVFSCHSPLLFRFPLFGVSLRVAIGFGLYLCVWPAPVGEWIVRVELERVRLHQPLQHAAAVAEGKSSERNGAVHQSAPEG